MEDARVEFPNKKHIKVKAKLLMAEETKRQKKGKHFIKVITIWWSKVWHHIVKSCAHSKVGIL